MIDWINAKDIPPPWGEEVLIFYYSDGSAGDKGFINYGTWVGNPSQMTAEIENNKFIFWAKVKKTKC